MEEDPVDPGGGVRVTSVPEVAQTVTIDCESSMDTDCSAGRPKKRTRVLKICKHCNRKRPRRSGGNRDDKDSNTYCGCGENHTIMTDTNIAASNAPTPTLLKQENESSRATHIYTPNGRKVYVESDSAPYVIHVTKVLSAPNDGSAIHPVSFGKFLKRISVNNIDKGSVKRIGRNRISMSFSTLQDANSFISNTTLLENGYTAFIPTSNISRVGIVKGIPTELSPEEIKDNITLPYGCGEITKLRRLNFKVVVDGVASWKPTQSVVFTFDGQILPRHVYLYHNSLPVELYIFPTIQCFNCCRYGHTQSQCRSKPKCYRCGHEHPGSSCHVEEDSVSCCHCSGAHHATSKSCPEFDRQRQIKCTMAQSCITYAEASKLHPSVSKPYVDVLASPPPVNNYRATTYSSNNSIQKPQSNSYKKTVFLQPRPPTKSSKTYDKEFHTSVDKEYNMQGSSQNGSALQHKISSEDKEMSVQDIINLLLTLLTKSNITLPPNVASFVEILKLFISTNGSQSSSDNTIELPQSSC